MQDTFPEGVASFSEPMVNHFGHATLEMSNRLLYRSTNIGAFKPLVVTEELDPRKHIRNAMGDILAYTEDNKVECYRREIFEVEGKKKIRCVRNITWRHITNKIKVIRNTLLFRLEQTTSLKLRYRL
jgi:hypothetical protein